MRADIPTLKRRLDELPELVALVEDIRASLMRAVAKTAARTT